MRMIGHADISGYGAPEAVAGVGKRIQIEPVVLRIDKRDVAVVTTLDDMLWLP
jgi:hypothetical protein